MNHCMLDLETMGTDPGCLILSIGAVRFSPYSFDIGPTFYANVDALSCLRAGLRVSDSTQDWWLSEENARALDSLGTGAVSLKRALMAFSSYYEGCDYVWANGPVADVCLDRGCLSSGRHEPAVAILGPEVLQDDRRPGGAS